MKISQRILTVQIILFYMLSSPLDSYIIVGPIGQGSFGTVFKAQNVQVPLIFLLIF